MGHNHSKHWYAVRVRSQHEDMVARHLRVRGLESFLPCYRQTHRWSDRLKEIDVPLFPGYVFCEFDPLNRLPVLTVPGVIHVVGTGKNPTPVQESEMAALQAAVKSGFPSRPWPFLEVGQKVRIACGPLAGVEGILLGFRGQQRQRIVLSVTLLQRSIAVEIDGEWVRPFSLKSEIIAKHHRPEHPPQESAAL